MAANGDGETARVQTPHGFSALKTGVLLDGRYIVNAAIAAGGFGITYIAKHETLGTLFAVKEHFPRQFAYRDSATSEVRPSDPGIYSWALDRFLQEGQSLAKCKHPNVVGVANIFKENGTAYMVLDYEEGQSFASWLKVLGRPPSQVEIDAVLTPLLDALGYVHAQGLLHRDIAPDNIMIRANGQPCLIDFGSARQAIAERSQVMSAIVKTGYSPPEQYTTSGKAQGAWSDIYALGATLYRALTGNQPPEATERQIDDDLKPISQVLSSPESYRPSFLGGIDAALRLRHGERPQSIDAWRAMLFGAEPPADNRKMNAASDKKPVPEVTFSTLTGARQPSVSQPRRKTVAWFAGSVVGLALVAIATNATGVWETPLQREARLAAERLTVQAETKRRTDAAAVVRAEFENGRKRLEEERDAIKRRLADAQADVQRSIEAAAREKDAAGRARLEAEVERQRLAAAAAAAAPRYSYVWDTRPPDDWLALRTEPSAQSGRQLARMANGTLIEVLEKRTDNWWRVRVVETGQEGWTLNRQGDRVWIYCCRAR